jgi:tetraacyldisaccharide 4'-kinase
VRRDRERKSAQVVRLSRRVVSVGNISMGGAGKTPMAAWLATEIHARGLRPAILTRGYRRRSPERAVFVPAGTAAAVEITGDEAQTFVRAGIADVCIGSDRAEAAALAQRLADPAIFLLDDGFQHWRLHRDVDIVLVDALDPFAGCHVFPRGRLREPLEAFARAGAFVITRCDPGLRIDAIERTLRAYNAGAPLFRSSVVAQRWIPVGDGAPAAPDSPPFSSAVAFCGLGNPSAFWRTLAALGVPVRFRWVFDDHHVYRPAELRCLAGRAVRMGATALITTEKDAMNLPDGVVDLIAPTPIYYLEIGVEVEDGVRLVDLCLGR